MSLPTVVRSTSSLSRDQSPEAVRGLACEGMVLVDRGPQLEVVVAAIDEARLGAGGSVVVRGEAGCGKTSLVSAALAAGDGLAVVWTSCEPLAAPRPLAPVHEALRHLGADRDAGDDDAAVLLQALRSTPTVLVVDDAHWADDATLDVLTRLAGAMATTPSVLVVTCRPSADDPLRAVLGRLARAGARQVATPPLTRASVTALASAAGRDGDVVFELTAGVPFLVNAVLDASGPSLPHSAVDAVLAATTGLDDDARAALDTIACVPRVHSTARSDEGLVPFDVLDRVGVHAEAIEAAETTQLLAVGPRGVAFRHEIGRLAVESAMSGLRRRRLHARLYDAFAALRADPAVLAHHAIGAGDDAAIIDACDAAARVAAAAAAHHQARTLLSHAVDAARRTRDGRLVELAERSAQHRYLTNDLVGAIEHQRLALGILLAGDDPERVAAAHLRLSRYSWFVGEHADARTHVDTALDLLRRRGSPEALAEALTARSRLAMLDGDRATVERTVAEAQGLLGRHARPDLRAALLDNLGTTRMMAGDDTGPAVLHEGIAAAERIGGEEYVRACTNAAYTLTESRRLDEAEHHLTLGISYARQHELDTWTQYMTGIRARWHLLAGRTAAALDEAELIDVDDRNELNRITPLVVLGTIAARGGSPDAGELLGQAMALARRFGEAPRIGPVLAAEAERAWLEDATGPVSEITDLLTRRIDSVGPMLRGELATWLRRLGGSVDGVDCSGTPFAHTLDGHPDLAADRWAQLGAEYDRALALIDHGVPASLLEARRICEEVEATATVAVIDHRLARAGVRVPRGPRASTAANVARLTTRQLEVLDLLAQGRTNAEIADELVISLKTAGHHVSAILTKLHARRRTEAVAVARQLGLLGRSS